MNSILYQIPYNAETVLVLNILNLTMVGVDTALYYRNLHPDYRARGSKDRGNEEKRLPA
jgi:hypothetical protein